MENEKMVLRTEGLVKRYGQRTVANNVSINVTQGEIVGLLGPNGAGKTTTFYMTTGLIVPNAGKIFLDDLEITKFPVYKRAQAGIGYLPQEASVFRKMTVEDNIKSVLEMTNFSKEYQKEKLEALIEEFNLGHVRHNLGDRLSGGERRRTEIARCLAIEPKFIMLDEPFAGVDPIAVQDIQDIVWKLKDKNIGILITDHNVDETLAITDRAYLLFEGKILFKGTPQELANNKIVREKYLGEHFELDENRRKDNIKLNADEKRKAVVLFSGGQDSTTCLFWAKQQFDEVYALGFDYGQKHKKENEVAKEIAENAGVPFKLVKIDALAQLHHNALTDPTIEVDHEKPEDALPNTFVPGRNLIFLTYAAIYAYSIGAKDLVTGVSQEDYSGYPDCREVFIKSANRAISNAIDVPMKIHTPLMERDKEGVWALSDELGVLDMVREKTLTCYNGIVGDGCGDCPACKLRSRGLKLYLEHKTAAMNDSNVAEKSETL